MKKIGFAVLLALSLLPKVSSANDSNVKGESGRWSRLSAGKTTVRMVREKVLLTMQEHDYDVDAQFVFRNDGPATSVQMGFPERGYGDFTTEWVRYHPPYRNFRTEVDGRRVDVKRRFTGTEDGYCAFWVKTVKFAARQTRRVRVRFRTSYGNHASDLPKSCWYDFTGGNWKGKVAESILTIRFALPGSYFILKEPCERRGNDLIFRYKNWEAEGGAGIQFGRVPNNWLEWSVSDMRTDRGLEAITVPGIWGDRFGCDRLSMGVIREGQTYINLSNWVDGAKAQMEAANGFVTVNYRGKRARYPMKPGGTPKTFMLRSGGDDSLYVPISQLTKDLGARFKVDRKQRTIMAYY